MTKVIVVYSGKGGVGKSTVASLLALALAKSHRVNLVDLDINTPSIPVLFGQRSNLDNLAIFSVGFNRSGLLDFSGAILRRVVKELSDKAKESDPDVIIIDMPPGLDDTHFELVSLMKPSFFVLVIQPNKLSEEDAKRTSLLWTNHNIPIAGVIQNMSGDVFGEYSDGEVLGLKLLGSIPLDKKIAELGGSGKIDEVANPLTEIADNLYNLADEADWKIVNKSMFEGLEFEDLISEKIIPDIESDDGLDIYKTRGQKKIRRSLYKIQSFKDIGFMGLKSWDRIRDVLMGLDQAYSGFTGMHMDGMDLTLELNSADVLRRMLESLDSSNTGLFMIVRPPNTQIPLFPGEVGTAHLYLEGKHYYGLPRVAYQTDLGEVVLFAHEIAPISVDNLNRYLEEGTLRLAINSKTPRYIPTRENLSAILGTFGNLIFMKEEWMDDYEELCGES
jgi:ATP-binding protein involved in chromosome partitioning